MNSSYQVVDLGTWYKLDLIQEKDNGEVLLYLIFFFMKSHLFLHRPGLK